MKCLIDTNILISASLFPHSIPAKAFMKAVTHPHRAVVCDYSVDEMRRVYNKKFPHKIHVFEHFLSLLLLSVEIISTPPQNDSYEQEKEIRDVDDRPILRAAIAARTDILITGDRDFLDSSITNPQIMTAAAFLE